MYKILGADGREYGPATADQVRAWINEGRANAATRVRLEGAAEWKLISEFPEFAAALAMKSPPPPQSAFGGSAQAEAIAAEILARNYDLDIGRCISRGWDLVFCNFWPIVGTSFVAFLLLFVAGSVPFANLVVSYVLIGGLNWYFLKLVRKERAELGDVMAGFSLAFVPLMLFSIVGQVLTGLGYLLCFLPGIYLSVAWMIFTPLLILDKKLDFWPAMELSRKVVSRHWWVVFGLFLVELGLLLLGVLVCCIGFLVAFPIVIAASVYAYEDIFNPAPTPGLAPAPALTPPATPPPPLQ